MPKLSEILKGKKSKLKNLDLRTEEQKMLQSYIDEALTKGTGPLAELFGYDAEMFAEGVEQPALKNFTENILPQLQESFIANNQVAGSGMQRAQNKAAVDLQSKLAELKYGAMNQGNQNKLAGLGLINQAQAKTPYVKEGSKGLLNTAAEGLAGYLGKGVGNALTGGLGAAQKIPTQVG